MSKSVIKSCKPYWIYLIIIGKKRIEVGKNYPKSSDWNRMVEMYCSKDKKSFNRIPEEDRAWMRKYLGKVALRFRCGGIMQPSSSLNLMVKASCVSEEELLEYANYSKQLYGWRVCDFVVYDTPKELREFKKAGYMTEEDWLYALYPNTHCHYAAWVKRFEFTHPPQTWCYLEGGIG